MTELLTSIDCLISACLPAAKCWGLARLIEDDNGKYPCTYKQDGSQGEKITPNDRYGIAFYHRLLDSTPADNDTYSFGRSKTQLIEQKVRTILIVDIKKNQKVLDQFLSSFAGETLDDTTYRFAQVGSSFSVNRDSTVVWEAEWDKAYKDKFQMRYFVWAIEYSVEYISC